MMLTLPIKRQGQICILMYLTGEKMKKILFLKLLKLKSLIILTIYVKPYETMTTNKSQWSRLTFDFQSQKVDDLGTKFIQTKILV